MNGLEERFMIDNTKKKIRVLEVAHGLAAGGIESFLLNVFENIDKDKFEITFALACNGKQFHEDRVLEQGSKVYHTSDLNGIANIIKHFFRLIKVLKTEGPFDVVHSNIDFFNGINLLAAFIAGIPIRISHSHNTNSAGGNSENPTLLIKLYRFIMKVLINTFSTDRLGCSQAANHYMHGVNWKQSKVIYNAIDLRRYSKDNWPNINPPNFDCEKINFITIGRMCVQKNSLFIIDIICELSKIRNDIHFTYIGTGPLENEIKEQVIENKLENIITFLGITNNIPEILSAMDIFLFPSRWEGLPVTLVEAQAMSLPCLISDTITPEADLGLCTMLSLKEDAKTWAKRINCYINNKSYNNKIDKEKLKKFDITSAIKEIEHIYCGI